ncbi:MAG: hypothetical protein AB7H90_13385 [Alphaproteobacteria bacterium]
MSITFQPIAVETGSSDHDGLLVLADGKLVGLLVRLTDAAHDPAIPGAWHLEAAFGWAEHNRGMLFASLDQASRTIAGWLDGRGAEGVRRALRPVLEASPRFLTGAHRRASPGLSRRRASRRSKYVRLRRAVTVRRPV